MFKRAYPHLLSESKAENEVGERDRDVFIQEANYSVEECSFGNVSG